MKVLVGNVFNNKPLIKERIRPGDVLEKIEGGALPTRMDFVEKSQKEYVRYRSGLAKFPKLEILRSGETQVQMQKLLDELRQKEALENDQKRILKEIVSKRRRDSRTLENTGGVSFGESRIFAANSQDKDFSKSEWVYPSLESHRGSKFTVVDISDSEIVVQYLSGPVFVNPGSTPHEADIVKTGLGNLVQIEGEPSLKFLYSHFVKLNENDLILFKKIRIFDTWIKDKVLRRIGNQK